MEGSLAPPTAAGAPPAPVASVFNVPVTVARTATGGLPTGVEVAAMISATNPKRRKRAGTHVVPQATAVAICAPAVTSVGKPHPPNVRTKLPSAGPKGGPPPKTKRPVSRNGPLPPSSTPPPVVSAPSPINVAAAHNVFEPMPAP